VDIQNGPTRQRDQQVNYYLGYAIDIGNHWSLGANAVAYVFPGATGNVDYDYEEYSVSLNYRDRAWLEYSMSPDLYATGFDTHNIDFLLEWQLPNSFTLGTGVGYYDVSELTGSGYAYWQAGVSRPVGIFDIDLRYHDTNRWVPIVSTDERAEARVSLSFRVHF
ncbi:MAG: TorF family putative porin, partial [Woeseiaceae bacterium]